METMDMEELRLRIDLENRYVEFDSLRSAVTLASLVDRLGMEVIETGENGEVRARCPKCGHGRSLAMNLESGRFNCFSKSCTFRGGGVIDFFGKLHGVFAKESAHLLAALFEVEPYNEKEADKEKESDPGPRNKKSGEGNSTGGDGAVTRDEFERLDRKVSRLSSMVLSYLLDDQAGGSGSLSEEEEDGPGVSG